ncbi:lactonase family protein [Periweissella beninensis]|uniref:Lactonase family protein n=2 Tax=Periweissella beninensis TaxID=504936 RepID=A0ABT0VFS6_9LACO|nr:lactonase family protein [Periweissella beninensis]
MMQEKILFGTYTKRVSEGVYEAILDTTQEKLVDAQLIATVGNPTYLTTSKANRLYAVDKHDGQGGLFVFDNTQRPAKKVAEHLIDSSPAYVAVDEQRQLVYAGYYHAGLTEVLKIDGVNLVLTDQVKNEGSGPRPEQGSAHVHFTGLTPDQRLVVVDLGTDKVDIYDVSAAGKLSLVSTYQAEAGFGPRHIRFSPDGQYAYLLGELSSQLSVLKYDATTGSLTHLQTTTTIPNNWTEHNGAAAIRVTNDGQYIYTSNRGNNSIAVFKTSDAGAHIELIQLIASEGDFPRDFALNSDETFVVVANQNTDNVSLFKRDAQAGTLSLIQKDFLIPEGVRVHFE